MKDLLTDNLILEALDYGDVMEWDGYDEALSDFLEGAREDYNVPVGKEFSFDDMAEVNSKGYWTIEIN